MRKPIILAIESSCDDTCAAVIRGNNILANVISGQEVHGDYGGVVPELASRAHQKNIMPVVESTLLQAGIDKSGLDAVAFTQGPGLVGALLVGASFAKGLAGALGIPLIAVHHLHAHLFSHYIDPPRPAFPFLCLLASGGHTQLTKLDGPLNYETIGRTTDDAAGEALDKAAKVLGLPYPGGPWIDHWARKGNPEKFSFPQPSTGNLDFSFSGLKTSLLYFVRDGLAKDKHFIQNHLPDICASYQETVVDYLLLKLKQAIRETGIHEVGIAGGVAANSLLRKKSGELARIYGWKIFVPEFQYCTDNAAMIAKVASYKFREKQFAGHSSTPFAR